MRVSFDQADVDFDVVHGFLHQAYWSVGIPRDTVERAVRGSLCAVALAVNDSGREQQIGFARVISDRATFAYLADVFVLPEHRGRGVARAMLEALYGHPDLQGLRRWMLATRDMQRVYAKLGWGPHPNPERLMTRGDPDIYTRGN